MNDRTLPWWLHVLMDGSALAQLVFGITLIIDPSAISRLWPWTLTPITARLLGASALVAVPLSLLASLANRWSVARIPTVMQLAYRVVQLIAGFIHIGRFDFTRLVTWNYFGGGAVMMVAFALVLIFHQSLGKPVSSEPTWVRADVPLAMGVVPRTVILVFAITYLGLGGIFFFLGAGASNFWFEEVGNLTPLTARLFASPTMGLVLALWLITRARGWSEVLVPAIGMVTSGLGGTIALILSRSSVAPPTLLGYLTAATPVILFLIGLFLLSPGRRGQIPVQG
jgi:hypothetical protein